MSANIPSPRTLRPAPPCCCTQCCGSRIRSCSSLVIDPQCAAHSVHSPPPCGEGLGVGVTRLARRRLQYAPPPSPALPHKGGGSRPSSLSLIPLHTNTP